MRFTKINLMVPTYGRAKTKLPTFIDSALAKADDQKRVLFTFCVNANDKDTIEYLNHSNKAGLFDIIIEDEPTPHLARFFNKMYKETRWQESDTVVSMLGDDMVFQTSGWDTLLLKWMNMLGGFGVYYGDDCFCQHEKMCVNLFTSREYIDAMAPNPFMCEMFPFDGIDTVHYQCARLLRKLIYIKELKIFHDHATRDRATGDETYNRLRKSDRIVAEKSKEIDEYAAMCANQIMENRPDQFRSDIEVIMTTCDRANLLEKTVASWNNSIDLPNEIHVFDDCSSDPRVPEIIGKMTNARLHLNERKLKYNMNTPAALEYMFTKEKAKAVFVVDSDSLFNRYWWIRLNHLYNKMSETGELGVISLYNANNNSSVKPNGDDMVLKNMVGAFGCLITKEYWEKYIKALDITQRVAWDNASSNNAYKDGLNLYVSCPSFMQHTGIYEGSHVGTVDQPSMADDFIDGDEQVADAFNIVARNDKAQNDKIFFSLMGRFGDVVAGSFFVNYLRYIGYQLKWLSLPMYQPLISEIAPDTSVQVHDTNCDLEWAQISTGAMMEQYSGYKYYINAQLGSAEHHMQYFGSGKSSLNYMSEYIEKVLGREMPRQKDIVKYRHFFKHVPPDVDHRDQSKSLLIIAPECISAKTPFRPEFIRHLVKKYSEDYDIKILVKNISNNIISEYRNMYLFRHSFSECVHIIRAARLFIGNDSGLAWASLFSSCNKHIYHSRHRLPLTNNRFAEIDPKAIDLIHDEFTTDKKEEF